MSYMSCIGLILGETLFGTSELLILMQSYFVAPYKSVVISLLVAYSNVRPRGLQLP